MTLKPTPVCCVRIKSWRPRILPEITRALLSAGNGFEDGEAKAIGNEPRQLFSDSIAFEWAHVVIELARPCTAANHHS
jgi:hypothetical protein